MISFCFLSFCLDELSTEMSTINLEMVDCWFRTFSSAFSLYGAPMEGEMLIVNTIHKIRFIVSVFEEVKVGMTRDVLSVMKLR